MTLLLWSLEDFINLPWTISSGAQGSTTASLVINDVPDPQEVLSGIC